MSDSLREKLLGFLAAGVPQTAAALACGCSDSYVSQLLTEDSFRTLLAERQSGKLATAVAHDESLEATEARALAALSSKLPFVKGPLEAARIFQILNSAKKRVLEAPNVGAAGSQQVTIVLPKAAQVYIQMNAQRQVIEVEGRSMATLPSKALPALSARLKEADEQRAELVLENVRRETVIGGVVCVL